MTDGSDATEHQIRIEISKTEVLDSMKKEHLRDLSLLYYDFNNSKARLMSKMKKMSDFVIQEEEADGDGVGGHRPDTDDHGKKATSPSRTSMNNNPSTLT